MSRDAGCNAITGTAATKSATATLIFRLFALMTIEKASVMPTTYRRVLSDLRRVSGKQNQRRLIHGRTMLVMHLHMPDEQQQQPDQSDHGQKRGDPSKHVHHWRQSLCRAL